MMNTQAAYHRSLTRWNISYYDHCRWVEEAPPAYQVYILYLILSRFKPQTTESVGRSLHCSHWRQSRTLVSVTTKHKSLHWACNRHLPMVGLPAVTGQAGKTEPGDFIIFIRVYSLATVEWKEFLPGSSLSHLRLRSRNNDLSFLFLMLVLWQLL